MRNLLIIFSFIFLLPFGILSQWQPEIRLTNAPGISYTSYNNAWPIAAAGDTVIVFFSDTRDGNDEIYYKRSTDGGDSWSADTRLTNAPSLSWCPSTVISGAIVHVVWYDNRDGNNEIYYNRSSDAGVSWGIDTRLSNAPGYSGTPSLAISGSTLHLTWEDGRDGNNEIYYKRSTDNGLTWEQDIRLTNAPQISELPSIAAYGSNVQICWDDRRDGNYEIYFKRSTDGGSSWEPDVRLTNNILSQYFSCLGINELYTHIVWYDNRVGFEEIYYKRSTDGGISFGPDTRLTNTTSVSEYPNIAVHGNNVHIVWDDDRNNSASDIYYKRSLDGGTTWEVDLRLTTTSTTWRDFAAIAVSGTELHVVWEDTRPGDGWEIYYMKNTNGNPIGVISVNNEIPLDYSLLQNYPNPFNPETKIRFNIPQNNGSNVKNVSILIYNSLGQVVETLFNSSLKPGSYEIIWKADQFSSGIYFYKLITNDFTETKKMVLIK